MDGKALIWASVVIAVSIAPAFSQRLSSKKAPAPASILAGDAVHDASAYRIAAHAGVSWLPYRNKYLEAARFGYNSQSGSFFAPIDPAPASRAPIARQVTLASALAIPAVVGGIGGGVGQSRPTVFGELAPIVRQKLASQAGDFAARLARAVADRATHDSLFGLSDPLSAKSGDKDIAGLGVVVGGVDEPPQRERSVDADSSQATLETVQTYPMSAAALASSGL